MDHFCEGSVSSHFSNSLIRDCRNENSAANLILFGVVWYVVSGLGKWSGNFDFWDLPYLAAWRLVVMLAQQNWPQDFGLRFRRTA